MKIRKGFVTNSSSSSFIIARKENLTEEQKEVILDYALVNLLGCVVISTKEELIACFQQLFDKDIWDEENNCLDEDSWYADQFAAALAEIEAGKVVCMDRVCFENSEQTVIALYHGLWKRLLECSDDFAVIDGDLDY